MSELLASIANFLSELRRRKVYRVAAAYVIVAAGALQLVDLMVPASRLPGWADDFFLALALLGFPLAVVLAWAFDVTPDGVRTTPVDRDRDDDVAPGDRAPATADDARPELDVRTVAVLPFENLSGTSEAEPFAVGLHDDLLTELSGIASLTVISRTSVQAYRDGTTPIRVIGRELDAGTVVEGGVQQSGDRVRLNVQVIDARTDTHVWAERYDRELTTRNLFEMQTELVNRIAAALEAELTTAEEERLARQATDDLEAYRLYVDGREALATRSGEGLRRGADLFRSALERDPEYALAWAGLGNALALLADYRYAESQEILQRAEEAARRALEIDPGLAEAHSALGNLHSYRRECPAALRRHVRASELRPSYARAHQWRCWVNLLMGEPRAAREVGDRATRLDPLDPEARSNLAVAHLGVGDPGAALDEARRVLRRHGEFDYARWVEGLALVCLERHTEAAASLDRLTEPWARVWPEISGAIVEAGTGNEEPARALLDAGDDGSFRRGVLLASLDELDDALDAWRRAGPLAWDETLFVRYVIAESVPGLERDPRYRELIAEVDRSWGVGA